MTESAKGPADQIDFANSKADRELGCWTFTRRNFLRGTVGKKEKCGSL